MTWTRKQRERERRIPKHPLGVRIVSDGTRLGTRVETDEGETIDGVRVVEWRMDATTGRADVCIYLAGVPIDARTDERSMVTLNHSHIDPHVFAQEHDLRTAVTKDDSLRRIDE